MATRRSGSLLLVKCKRADKTSRVKGQATQRSDPWPSRFFHRYSNSYAQTYNLKDASLMGAIFQNKRYLYDFFLKRQRQVKIYGFRKNVG